jgi:hypothetical protein
MRATSAIPLGCPLLLPADTVYCCQTLQVWFTELNAMQMVLA